jgi:hypothetical protein
MSANVVSIVSEYRYGIIALVTSMLVALLARAAKKPARSIDGWHSLTPGIGLYLIASFGLLLSALFGLFGIITPLAMLRGTTDGTSWFLLFCSPVMFAIGLYVAAYTFACRIKFNESGITRHFAWTRVFVPWSEVLEIKRHWFFGPMVVHKTGRFIVWEYLRGFADLCHAATTRSITVRL